MSRGYFGTDGIRGRVGEAPLTPPHLLSIALAAGRHLVPAPKPGDRVVIGMDTRASGPAIADVLAAGLAVLGLDVVPLGVLPTPALAFGTRAHGAKFGIMVTASHNPAGDNGIKLFGADGFKLAPEDEAAIERLIDAGPGAALTDAGRPAGGMGSVAPDPSLDVRAVYADTVLASLPEGVSLAGLKLVFDGANGAGFDIGPFVLRQLGAEVEVIGTQPNGQNVNDQVGSTHPGALARKVRAVGAYAGIALDGDGDRLIMVDEAGTAIDGDQLIGLLARMMQQDGTLAGDTVVTTVMSNLGLERHLQGNAIAMPRTAVGDRHVVDAMRAGGFSLGGEQSGHIVMLRHGTTGDGLLAALHVLVAALRAGRAFSEVASVFEPAPQKLVNVRYAGPDPLEQTAVKAAIEAARAGLGDDGRLVVRKSGTEPKIRIMAEALDPAAMETAIDRVVSAVEAATEA
ncbi:MAG: phosphoglucosamine mutase [Pseudomonadota bacterium]